MSTGAIEDIENCFKAGWSDGLPVIPPYQSLVDSMLNALHWGATEVVGGIPSQSIEVRGEHLAAAAVMAGCTTAYAPLLRPLAECLLDPAVNLSGVEVTTGGVAALVLVSGPIVDRIGLVHEANALGANARANATIGRFAQLVRLFCGRGGGALQSHGTVGHPGRLSFLIAEHPDPIWPGFHSQVGAPVGASAVSVMAAEGPNSVNNHFGTSGADILDTIASCVAHLGTTNIYYRHGAYVITLAPDHAALVTRDFSRAEAQAYLAEHAVQPTDELIRVGRIPAAPRSDLAVVRGELRPPVRTSSKFHFIESGAPGGKFSAVIPAWAGSRNDVWRSIEH
ncbi:hypothetical protein [Microbacterium sp. NPDC055357]